MCWCWMPKSSCSVRSMYLQELNFILLFTGGGEHNVDFIVQRPYFSRLAEGGPHSGTPVDAMAHSSLRPLWVIKSRTGMYSNV